MDDTDKMSFYNQNHVEGYEFQVLNGAKDTLDNQELIAVIIELNGSVEKTRQMIAKFMNYY